MEEKCTGAPLRPSTQWPSHWFSWLHTRLHTVVSGLFSKSVQPASSSFPSSIMRMTLGMGVWMGHPF